MDEKQFIFSISWKSLDRFAHVAVVASLFVIMASFAAVVYATVPNPGHSITEINFAQTTYASDATISTAYYSVLADASAGPLTLTLPSASANPDKRFWIKKVDTSLSNIVTILPQSGETIGSLSSVTLANRNESMMIQSDGAVWRVLSRRAYDVSGYRAKGSTLNQWYTSPNNGQGLTTGAPSANTLRAIPFVVSKTMTIDQMSIRVTTLKAGTARIGIYNDDGNDYPGSLIVEATASTQINVGATGVKVATDGLPVTLDPGLYWLAIVSDAAPTVRGFAVNSLTPVLGMSATLGTAASFGWSVAYTYAALPDPFTSGGSPITTVPIPAIFVRAAE